MIWGSGSFGGTGGDFGGEGDGTGFRFGMGRLGVLCWRLERDLSASGKDNAFGFRMVALEPNGAETARFASGRAGRSQVAGEGKD